MYSRNYLYITEEEQFKLKNFHITLAGTGLGSNIAECAIRLGFKTFTLIDGDKIERSNLNRQVYTNKDIGEFKVEALKSKMLEINPYANIICHNVFLDTSNIDKCLSGSNVVINTIDYGSKMPFILDSYCNERNIFSIHPFNLGWAGYVFITGKDSKEMDFVCNDEKEYEICMVKHIIKLREQKGIDCSWLNTVVDSYKNNFSRQSPPQLAIGSHLIAGLVGTILFNIATGKRIRISPDFYFVDTTY